MCRNHLPTLFPWSKEKKERRELKRQQPEQGTQIRKRAQKTSPTELLIQEKPLNSTTTASIDEVASASLVTSTGTLTKTYTETASQTDVMLEITALKENLLALEKQNLVLENQNSSLKIENEHLKKEGNRLKTALDNPRFDIEKYMASDEDIAFYTGFPDYNAMLLCFKIVEESARNMSYDHQRVYVDMPHSKPGRPRTLTLFQEFTLVMMRLRLGLFERDIAHRYSISITAVSRITRTWVRFLRCEFEPLITIPSNDIIKLYMPAVFNKVYPRLSVIVDCTEIEKEKPSSLDSQSACYSSYKSRTNMKALLGITPSGVLCFFQ